MSVEPHRFPGVFTVTEDGRTNFATRSLVPSQSVYGERIVRTEEGDFRVWSLKRSKLAAAMQNGLGEMPIQPGSRVLYLGASSGTTVSHVSDIVGPEGVVYAVEFSATIARSLIRLAASRSNIVPIIEDARHPARYAPLISSQVDVAYQDIAQPDQARILHDNVAAFCSYGSWAMIAIKARSIDSTSDVTQVYSREISKLDALGLEVIERIDLEPFDRDHVFAVCRVREDMK